MARIVVLAPVPAETFTGFFPDHEVVAVGRDEDPAVVAAGADVVIADWSAHHRVAGAVIEALQGTCRLVQVPAAGLDSVDVDACLEAGIPIANAAGLNAVTVAEWCVWAAIEGSRHLGFSDRALRAGSWEQTGHARFELAGKVVGLVGLGDIGAEAARRFAPFGVDLRYWTRTRRPAAREAELQLTWSELDDLVAAADVLVLAIALTTETRGLLSADRIATMQPTAVVVNAARGAVADESALATAVREGRLHAVVTDVYTTEPPPADHPLVGLDRTTATPHLAGATAESITRMFVERTVRNVGAALRDERPEGIVQRT